MRITQDFLNHLSPVELSFIRTGIDKLYKEKVTPDTTNYENIESHVQRCPHCGSVHFVKNGFNPKHRQKYRCKDCNTVFSATTGTMFSNRSVSSIRRIPLRCLCLINQCLEKSEKIKN